MTISRAAIVLCSTLIVSACGSGGGGSSAPAPVPTANVSLPATQRAAGQSAVSVLAIGVIDHSFASGTGPALLSIDRQAASLFSARRTASSACTNFQTLTVTGASNTGETTEAKVYYDAACTLVASDVIDRLTFQTQPAGVTLDAVGTFYTRSGSVAFTSRITGVLRAVAPGGISEIVTETLAADTASAPFETIAYGCTLAASGAALSGPCTQAALLTPLGGTTAFGELATLTQTVTPGSGTTTLSATGTFQLSSGPAGSIDLTPGATPTLVGGTALAFGTIAEGLAFTGSTTTGTLTTTDGTSRLTTTVTPNAGGFTGTIVRDGISYAQFTIDAFGNGSISYADGTTGIITGFAIK